MPNQAERFCNFEDFPKIELTGTNEQQFVLNKKSLGNKKDDYFAIGIYDTEGRIIIEKPIAEDSFFELLCPKANFIAVLDKGKDSFTR